MSEDWGNDGDEAAVVAPEVQDIKLFGKWSTDDVQVSDISLTVSTFRFIVSDYNFYKHPCFRFIYSVQQQD